MSSHRHIRVEPLDTATVIRLGLKRVIDDPATDELRHEIAAVVSAATLPNFIVDLAAVDLVSSAGISVFRDLYRAVAARKGQVVLSGPRPEIRTLMRMVGLDTIFSVHEDVAAAAAAF
ncbi:MAG: STAS domain-containing protein [Planctomycetia bacterium]